MMCIVPKNDVEKMYIFQLYILLKHPFELILCCFSEFSFLFLEGKPSCCHFVTRASKEIIFNHLTCAIKIILLSKGVPLNFNNW